MGLAFQSLAQTQSIPFWQHLIDGNQLAAPEMAFFLTRYNGGSYQMTEPGGVMTLGGINSTFFQGDIDYVNLVSGVYWGLALSGITVQGQSVSVKTGLAAMCVIDTGTTLIGGPSADVQALWASIPSSQPLTGRYTGFYGFRMSSLMHSNIWNSL